MVKLLILYLRIFFTTILNQNLTLLDIWVIIVIRISLKTITIRVCNSYCFKTNGGILDGSYKPVTDLRDILLRQEGDLFLKNRQ